ncbi:MAG: type II toxin-antitoxin system RelE/ParE family toxin [Rhodomicrobium sp.]
MRVFKTKGFARFARQEAIGDDALAKAIRQAESGLIDADLHGGLIKLRLARPGSGKRGGYRTLIAYKKGSRAVFLFGIAKSDRENISPDQLADLRAVAGDILNRSGNDIEDDLEETRLQEVDYDGED